MDLAALVIIILAFLVVVVLPFVLSSHWRLMAAVWLAVFQVYTFPVHGFYPSLAFLFSISLWPELIKHGKELLRWRITQYYFLLLAVQVISLAWSPDIGMGMRLIALMIPFAFILAASIEVTMHREDLIRLLAYGILAGAVIESILAIGFHLMPAWGKLFLSSSISQIFINPNTLLFEHIRIKQFSAFLVNPNTAAAYMGITSLFAQALAFRYRQWWLALTGVFIALGVVFTGSKAGLILLVVLYPTGCFMLAWPKYKKLLKASLMLIIVITAVVVFLSLDALQHVFGNSWTNRVMLWNYGLTSFQEKPLQGLGFGGWEIGIQEYVKQVGYSRVSPPPHNTIISLWSQSGLVAAVLGILFMVEVVIFFWRSRIMPKWREFMICATLAMVWYFIHQQANNWGLVNERHIMPIIALLIGIVYTVSHRTPQAHEGA
jgi:O-antigen ligase